VRFLVTLLLPPIGLLVFLVIGFALLPWRRRLGRIVIAISFALLWASATPAFNVPLIAWVSWPAPVDLRDAKGAQAIVVLGGGVYLLAPEYGGKDTVNWRTLERVRYATRLHKQTGLPILAAGGRSDGTEPPEGLLMKAVFEQEFSVPVRWTEVRSRNTLENARYSARILREAGIARVILVTEALHMRRSIQSFSGTGIEVVPAPTAFKTGYHELDWTDFLPAVNGFTASYQVSHEIAGRAWYWIRQRFD
jgi:uncharacterized SAM-binding protein YcdF (DUF218 family)